MRTAGILVALDEEAQGLLRRASWVSIQGSGRMPLWRCRQGSLGVTMVRSGAGLPRARAAAEALIRRTAPTGVILAGLSGGLAPDLRPGQLLLGGGEGELLGLARQHLAAREAELLSLDRPVLTAQEKHALWQRTGAQAVDMESSAASRAATLAGLPWVCLRAVSDPAGVDLPLDFSRTFDARGLPSRAAILAHLLRNPAALPGLVRLARDTRLALEALSGAVWRLLEAWEARP